MTHPPPPETDAFPHPPAALHTRLLPWFQQHARDLPWRHTRDPYHILVAEMMLQQTQVERVIPRYHHFLEVFPTLEALAAAPTADVIREWAGLGYNRRAVNLQRAARTVRDEHGGVFPQTVDTLQTLPGIGAYTAGALACFVFEHDVVFADTNIRRVLCRVLLGAEPLPPGVRERDLLALARAFLPPGKGWVWNQALMELGAMVCAVQPACERCPLLDVCPTGQRRTREPMTYTTANSPITPPRKIKERPEPFVGSNRYYRGRVVAALRALPTGESVSLAQLGEQVRDDYRHNHDALWLRELCDGLVRDGLAEWVGEAVRLPGQS